MLLQLVSRTAGPLCVLVDARSPQSMDKKRSDRGKINQSIV